MADQRKDPQQPGDSSRGMGEDEQIRGIAEEGDDEFDEDEEDLDDEEDDDSASF